MKTILFLFILTGSMCGHAQNLNEIRLSKTLDESRMGVWEKGDYKIYIELSKLENTFRNNYESNANGALNRNIEDTVTALLYHTTAKRYLAAAEQLKDAANGFNLSSLIIYFGLENESDNKGNSIIVENYITQLIESGQAVVYYKGKRIETIMSATENEGQGLDYGYHVRLYYDDVENAAIKYYRHLGW